MGVGTYVPVAASPRGPGFQRLLSWTTSPVALRRLALSSLVANVLIVVTGGAVRLTKSGLGCPTWPSCSGSSLVATHRLGIHGAIEFTNRSLTFVVGLLAALTLVAAWRQRRHLLLALIGFLGIPAQALLGGITVLTDLNPYAVAAHFLLSMAVLAVYALLRWRLAGGPTVDAPRPAIGLARLLAAVSACVLTLGTVVTGSGPHAGDVKAGKLHRIHVSSASASQLHADAVMVLIGVTIGMLALAYALGVSTRLRRAVGILLGVELAQGIIGYTQYFLDVPPLLVAVHMLGACLVWLAALYVLLLVEPRAARVTTAD